MRITLRVTAIFFLVGFSTSTFSQAKYDKLYNKAETAYQSGDYKSAASVERIEAFLKLGRRDPVEYADETGPVSWETAVSHVEGVLKEHAEK